MKLALRPESEAIVAKTRADGVPLTIDHVLAEPLPHAEWWSIVSRSAKSDQPYDSAIKELIVLTAAEPTVPPWPEGLYEEAESLPGISRPEALGLLDRFLRAERGRLEAGVQIHLLHWDLLAAQYCPLRARFPVVTELVSAGLLVESAGTALHHQSGLRWPLTVTPECVRQISRARLDVSLPTVRRLEDFLEQISSSYPLAIKAVASILLGGGAVKVIEWVIAVLK